jgi:hypothetical protein
MHSKENHMLTKILVSIFLILSSTQALAAIINANDFALGTDVSHSDGNASLSWLHSSGNIADGIQYLPVTIQSSDQSPEQYFVGATHSLTWGIRTTQNYNAALNELQPFTPFAALLVSFATPITQFGFKAENMSGDGMFMFLYDSAQQPIATGAGSDPYAYGIPLAPDFTVYTGEPFPAASHYNYFDKSFNFDFDVSYALIGGWDSSTYIYEINSSVPEPGVLLIFLLGLTVVAIRRVSTMALSA